VRSQLSFKVHRAVNSRSEVITATAVTSGAVNEGHLLADLVEQQPVKPALAKARRLCHRPLSESEMR